MCTENPTTEASWLSKDDGTAETFIESKDNFILDTDGVLWAGDEPLPGAFAVLQLLKEKRKKVVFVTNNSNESREEVAAKLCRFGYAVTKEDIVTSASAAAEYLQTFHPSVRKVYVVGGAGVVQELDHAGIAWCGGTNEPTEGSANSLGSPRSADSAVGAVLVGWDRQFTFDKLSMASHHLQRGCALIATNKNLTEKVEDGKHIPGTGALVAAIEATSGVEAVVTGKPSMLLVQMICDKHGFDKARTAVLGDRVDTDVAMGNAYGLDTVLVLSGMTHENDLDDICNDPAQCPNFIAKTLGELV